MAANKRLAIIGLILVAGVVGALLFPKSPDPAQDAPPAETPLVQFRDTEPAAERSTLLKPVETDRLAAAPTVGVEAEFDRLPALQLSATATAVEERPLPTFRPQPRPELPILTDETWEGEFMEPPTRALPLVPLARPSEHQPADHGAADGLTPIAPRREPATESVARQAVAPPLKRHIVRDGDTLEKLARRYLGDADRYREIFALNQETIRNPDVLPLGIEVKIPPRKAVVQPKVGPTAPAAPPLIDTPSPVDEPNSETNALKGPFNPLRGERPPLEPIRRGN